MQRSEKNIYKQPPFIEYVYRIEGLNGTILL